MTSLLHMMTTLGFPKQFVGWIEECISTISYNILFNGETLPSFPTKKGLRPGDPLSIYLLTIVMEYLTRRPSDFGKHTY